MFRHDPAHTGYSTSTAPINGVTQLWNYSAGGAVFSSPAVVESYVYISFHSGVHCVNASTGAKVWESQYAVGYSSSPAVVDGVVYLGSEDGKVYALGAPSATVTPPPLLSTIIVIIGVVVVVILAVIFLFYKVRHKEAKNSRCTQL